MASVLKRNILRIFLKNFTEYLPAMFTMQKDLGLGLNFVKRIIDAHDGKIKVNSIPGIGTEFKLVIPR
jgi:nitrogen-specific signal transduction histidine kinase